MRFLRSKKNRDISDEELLEEYRRSPHSDAIGILFDRYCHLAFAVCMKYLKDEEESKDAVLHIFEQLQTDLQKYRIQKFSHWLYILTKNHCLKALRNRKHFSSLEEVEPIADESMLPDSEKDFDLTPLHLDHLTEALGELGEEQSICIRKFFLEEMTYSEISAQTGFSFRQVKSFIQNGKRNLRNYLQKKNGNV